MAKIALTDKFIKAAMPGTAGRVDIFDAITPGLNLRVTADRKAWSFLYTAPGGTARARLGLGTYPATDLATARLRAVEARGRVESGIDPRAIEAPKAVKTVAQVIDARIARDLRHSSKRYVRTCLGIERRYDKHVIPAKYGSVTVGQIPITEFGPKHLKAILEPIEDRGTFIEAIHVFQDVRALLNFAKREGDIVNNLISDAVAPQPPVDENGEEEEGRVLTLDEIRTVWRDLAAALAHAKRRPAAPGHVSQIELQRHVDNIAKLELALGQRISEIAGMRKSEFDLKHNRPNWTIPADRVKNKKGKHIVPLNGIALEIVRRCISEASGEVLFPHKHGQPVRNDVICKLLSKAQEPRGALPLGRLGFQPAFTSHDLRRTVSDLPSQSALNLPTADRYMDYILNHRGSTKNTVRKRNYNPYQFFDEKAAALEEWGAFLARLVGADTRLRVAA